MASLNTSTSTELIRYMSLKTGKVRAVRSDGAVLERSKSDRKWRVIGRAKIDAQVFADRIKTGEGFKNSEAAGHMVYGRSAAWPGMKSLADWSLDGVCEATDGCRIEPDGHCEHGYPSWLLVFGII